MAGTALVTGASSGIGEETVRGLLAAGYVVYAGARRVDAMHSLEAAGARVLFARRDRRRLNDRRRRRHPARDGSHRRPRQQCRLWLLRGAGGRAARRGPKAVRGQSFRPGAPDPARPADDAGAPRSGRIVNVSSISGKIGEPFGCWYHASKHALEGLSDSLRMELQPVRHRRRHHRAGVDAHRMGRDRARQPDPAFGRGAVSRRRAGPCPDDGLVQRRVAAETAQRRRRHHRQGGTVAPSPDALSRRRRGENRPVPAPHTIRSRLRHGHPADDQPGPKIDE